MTVELQEATKAVNDLADSAASGEEVLLVRDGKAVARVVALLEKPAVTEEQAQRRLGFLKGKYTSSSDIKTPFKKEIEEMFYGNPDKFNR